jgi:peptidoglycan/LPS O-acetylase OafA/YrhL
MNLSGLEPRKLGAAASAHLDLIRALAAWAVMWGHLRTLFFVDFQHLVRPGWILKAIYLLTGFGHQAVMVFFVLSGFLISSTVIKSHLSGTWSWRDYAINRSTRLYVVLIPGLLFGLLWDVLGGALFAAKGIYTHPVSDLGPAIAADNLTAGDFFGNLFYLQTIFCSTFGSNGPLWSLANEFWYYALFPVALAAGLAWARRSLRAAIPLTALVFCLGFFLGLEKLIGFLIWISGCALVFAYSRMRLRAKGGVIFYILASSVILGGCLLSARTSNGAVLGSDLAVGMAFTLFLFGILQLESGADSPSYSNTARLFAGFSYSLYVLHFPLLLFLRAWLVPVQRWQPNAANCALAILIGVLVLSFAWFVSRFTENKTHVARNWVRRTLGQSS